jgi:hypothetical protein
MTDEFARVQAHALFHSGCRGRTALALRRAAAKGFKMLACIACSTKDSGDQDGGPRAATPHGRDAGKSLTSQVECSPTCSLCLKIYVSFRFSRNNFNKIYIKNINIYDI